MKLLLTILCLFVSLHMNSFYLLIFAHIFIYKKKEKKKKETNERKEKQMLIIQWK